MGAIRALVLCRVSHSSQSHGDLDFTGTSNQKSDSPEHLEFVCPSGKGEGCRRLNRDVNVDARR